MDIERNLWTTCLVLMETTSTAPDEEEPGTVSDRTDKEEIEEATKKRGKSKKHKKINNVM